MRSAAVRCIDGLDRLCARASLRLFGDEPALIALMFHGLFPDRDAFRDALFDPQQGLTGAEFRALVAHFRDAGYQFVRPDEICGGLTPGGKYVLLTFDDGYFNNLSALPILAEFDAAAVFFISAKHVLEGKAYWWDVLYREMMRRGRSMADLDAARTFCKAKRSAEIEAWVRAEWQLSSLTPSGDFDRPMTPAELKELAAQPCAVIGNHTYDHANLTNCTLPETRREIEQCQRALQDMAGVVPCCIAYPDGDWNPEVVQAAFDVGLRSGVTTIPGKNYLPLPANPLGAMTLNREIPWGNRDISGQCTVFRTHYSIRRALSRARNQLYGHAY